MVLLDQHEELPDLIRLGFAPDSLEIELFCKLGVPIDVMTAPDAVELEATGLHQPLEVHEANVLDSAARKTAKKLLRLHAADGSVGV